MIDVTIQSTEDSLRVELRAKEDSAMGHPWHYLLVPTMSGRLQRFDNPEAEERTTSIIVQNEEGKDMGLIQQATIVLAPAEGVQVTDYQHDERVEIEHRANGVRLVRKRIPK